jgi:acyl carrier protein
MTQFEETAERIDQWLKRTFPLAQERGVGLHDSLLDSGIIDSLGTLEIVQFLESELGIQVTDEEMVGDNFESIYAIAQFADSKLQACSADTNAN